MDSRVSNLLWFALSTAIILAIVYFADIGRVLRSLGEANFSILMPTFVVGLSIFAVRAFTWHSFFKTIGSDASYFQTFQLFMAGNFLNSVTPLGQFGGEPFMAYIVSSNTDSNYEKAFSTVFSADVVNAIPPFTFIIGGSIYLIFLGTLNELIVQVLYIALLTTFLGGIVVYILWFEAGLIEGAIVRFFRGISGLLGRGESIVNEIERRLNRMEENFRRIGENPRHLLKTAVIAHIAFVLELVTIFLILFSLGHHVNFTPLYFVMPLASLAAFSPTPGGSGTYEAAMAGLLTLFLEIGFPTAVVAAVLFRVTTYWQGLLTGYVFFNVVQS